MNKVSLAALLLAIAFAAPTYAQDVSISVSAPDVTSVVSSVVSEASSAVSSATSEASSAVSSATSEASSAVSSAEASSEMSSGMSSESSMMNSDQAMKCGNGSNDLDIAGMMIAPMDEGALASVTSVTVLIVDDCSGLQAIDGATEVALETNPAVMAALAANGNTGAEVIAYNLADASLTVYVRKR